MSNWISCACRSLEISPAAPVRRFVTWGIERSVAITALTLARKAGAVAWSDCERTSTASLAGVLKPAPARIRSARAASPVAYSASESLCVPAIRPALVATATNRSQIAAAAFQCSALQRPARAAKFDERARPRPFPADDDRPGCPLSCRCRRTGNRLLAELSIARGLLEAVVRQSSGSRGAAASGAMPIPAAENYASELLGCELRPTTGRDSGSVPMRRRAQGSNLVAHTRRSRDGGDSHSNDAQAQRPDAAANARPAAASPAAKPRREAGERASARSSRQTRARAGVRADGAELRAGCAQSRGVRRVPERRASAAAEGRLSGPAGSRPAIRDCFLDDAFDQY